MKFTSKFDFLLTINHCCQSLYFKICARKMSVTGFSGECCMIHYVTDSGLFAWGFRYDCMAKCMCVTLILCLTDCYLCDDWIIYPRRDDRDHASIATSESSEKFNKTPTENCWFAYLKNLKRNLQTTYATEILGVLIMKTGVVFNYCSSSIQKTPCSLVLAGWKLSSYFPYLTATFFAITHSSTSRYASRNQIGDDGASKLGESIAKLKNLSSLDINLR